MTTKEQELNNKRVEIKKLRDEIKAGTQQRVYIFFGEERYMLDYCLGELRKKVASGTEEFNHRRFDGKTASVEELRLAVDSVPVFSEFVFIEVWDYDFSKKDDAAKAELIEILSDVPEYMTVVFVYDTVEYKKLDGRTKLNKELLKLLNTVEFVEQDEGEVLSWIARHFREHKKKIDKPTAEYLAFVTGGLMTNMAGEIEKVAAYSQGEIITRGDIDAVVIPVVEAMSYELTDALMNKRYDQAVKKLSDLFYLNEVPHKILFTVALTFRQLLAAKVLQAGYGTYRDLMSLYGIRFDFQAKNIFNGARKFSLRDCRRFVELTDETAYKLNSGGGDGEELMRELLVKIAANGA